MDDAPQFDCDDMKKLAEMSREGSVTHELLEDCDFQPDRFRDLLATHNLKKDLLYLFEMPLTDLPLHINEEHLMGYIKFRVTVAK
jgi:hypothetical protein